MTDLARITLDWDYDTFHLLENGDYVLYDAPVNQDGPERVVIDGYPGPGHKLEPTVAVRVGPLTYRPEASS